MNHGPVADSSTILQYWGHIHYSSGGQWTISLTVGHVSKCSSSRTRYWGNIRPIMSTIISPIITLSIERKILIQTKYSFLMKWWSSWFMIIKKFLLCPSVLVIGIIGNSSILTGYIFCISVEFHIDHSMPDGQLRIKTNHDYLPVTNIFTFIIIAAIIITVFITVINQCGNHDQNHLHNHYHNHLQNQ